ncbi:MAG: cobyrinic acid a,c-diamide synthase, partial [Lachnospiraceae bacterium]|nr:cobyrinic acid a,c-diamide synthase [Lachnospiraceae bacterium]
RGHEFHYYDSTLPGGCCMATKPGSVKSWNCMISRGKSLWGFPHLYYPSSPVFAQRFAAAVKEYDGRVTGKGENTL